MDRLAIMRSLVAVGKARSFSAAARTLGVSGSLVSRHIADLEEQLGVRLVNRTARAVSLTEQGQRYLEFSERLLREVDEEDSAIRGMHDRAEGDLSIVSPKWIGSLDLSDAVAAFAAQHPAINVHFDVGGMSDRTYEFVEKGYDVAFHTRDLRDSSVKVRRVAVMPFVLCASPSYLRKHGTPESPAELAEHRCLTHVNDPIWHFEDGGRQISHKVAQAAFSSNTYLVLQKAVQQGLGIAQLPFRPIAEEVAQERIRLLLPDYPVPSRPLFVVYPPGLQSVKKLRVFLEFIGTWFKSFPSDDVPSPAPTNGHPREHAGLAT